MPRRLPLQCLPELVAAAIPAHHQQKRVVFRLQNDGEEHDDAIGLRWRRASTLPRLPSCAVLPNVNVWWKVMPRPERARARAPAPLTLFTSDLDDEGQCLSGACVRPDGGFGRKERNDGSRRCNGQGPALVTSLHDGRSDSIYPSTNVDVFLRGRGCGCGCEDDRCQLAMAAGQAVVVRSKEWCSLVGRAADPWLTSVEPAN